MIIGILGSILLLMAWMPETYRTVKSKNVEAIDLRFLVIYVAGSFLLALYSYQIGDLVFMGLNSAIMLITLIELDIVLRKKWKNA